MWNSLLVLILILPVFAFPAIYLALKADSKKPSLPLIGAMIGALIAIGLMAFNSQSMKFQCATPNTVPFLDCILWLIDGFIATAFGALAGTLTGALAGLIVSRRNNKTPKTNLPD
jgi:membrane associated rhomboid family serine protease